MPFRLATRGLGTGRPRQILAGRDYLAEQLAAERLNRDRLASSASSQVVKPFAPLDAPELAGELVSSRPPEFAHKYSPPPAHATAGRPSRAPPQLGRRRAPCRPAATEPRTTIADATRPRLPRRPRRVLRRPDHHGHPGREVPLDVAVKEPEPGVVLLPLDDGVAASVDADRVLLAG